ncbi:hypothetical protein N7V53_10220 [Kosakonia sp. HypNH10]|uniref:hypothetical protein n=1 Tax=Kosakonia sp. HypNH10 TaxID=2980101 RepID=UPI00244829E9|nr:hypothetical protein [Kosakonia sp. HypNH10]MDH2912900.1 hypothetical protein [Kosakonia sp. HypNH10]
MEKNMFRAFLVTATLILFPLSSYAVEVFHHGILQAYWLQVFNNDGTKKTAQLKYRYFVVGNTGHVDKVINLDFDDNTAVLNEYFPHLSFEFKNYSEGHAEQSGNVTIDGLQKQVECDRTTYNAKMISFVPLNDSLPPIAALENSASCESWPWAETYILKEGVNGSHFKKLPDNGALNTLEIKPAQPLIKIKTVNDEWIRAAILDEKNGGPKRKTEGFIKLDQLRPVN